MTPSFGEARVLALESRRAVEVGTLITTFGGRATVAPALREVPAEAAPAVRAFGEALVAGELDIVILLTGVGARALFGAVDAIYGPERVRTALAATRILARGPKPLAVLRELAVPAWAVAAEPNSLVMFHCSPGVVGVVDRCANRSRMPSACHRTLPDEPASATAERTLPGWRSGQKLPASFPASSEGRTPGQLPAIADAVPSFDIPTPTLDSRSHTEESAIIPRCGKKANVEP